jgi:hypothetical protein
MAEEVSLMLPDIEGAVARVFMQINDLRQSLMGYGTPRVTPAAQLDGDSLADALRALQATIDEFLAGRY